MTGVYYGSGSDCHPLRMGEVFHWLFVDVCPNFEEILWKAETIWEDVTVITRTETTLIFQYDEERTCEVQRGNCYDFLDGNFTHCYISGFIPMDEVPADKQHNYHKSGTGKFLKRLTRLQVVYVAKFLRFLGDLNEEILKSYTVYEAPDSEEDCI